MRIGLGRRILPALAALAVAGVVLAARQQLVTLTLMPVFGVIAIWLLSRSLANDRWIFPIAAGSLGLGTFVTVGLYWLSAIDHPALRALVYKPGFWTFGGDAVYYHQRGLQMVHSLRYGVPFPDMDPTYGGLYLPAMGLMYLAFGAHPLVAPLLNTVLRALTVVLVHRLAVQFARPSGARFAATLVAFWPSLFVWSSQAIKDTASLFVLSVTLVLAFTLMDGRSRGASRTAALVIGLLLSVFVLYSLRSYLAVGVLLAAVAAIALTWVATRRAPRWQAASAAAMLLLGVIVGRIAGPDFLVLALNPTGSPAIAPYRRGLDLEAQGQLAQARQEYQRAIDLHGEFWPAWRRLGEVLVRLGELAAAEPALTRYLQLNPYDYSVPVVKQTLAQIAIARRAREQSARIPREGATGQRPAVAEDEHSQARREIVAALDESSRTFSIHVNFMLADLSALSGRIVNEGLARTRSIVSAALPEEAAALRNGFVRTGGETLYTRELAQDDSPLQWIRWAPHAFVTVLVAPYPWQWFRAGRPVPLRVAMGLEALVLLALLPFALWGSWRIATTAQAPGIATVLLFLGLTLALGLVVVNVGTLVRLRIPVIVLLALLTAACWGPRAEATGTRHRTHT